MKLLTLLKKPFSFIFRHKILFIVFLLLVGGGLFYFNSSRNKAPIETVTVKKSDLKSTVSSSGVLKGKDTVNLKFKSSGKLAYLNVNVGDSIKKGDVVAGLDTQDLSITLQQARNNLVQAEATLAKTYDDVKDHATDETLEQRDKRTKAEVAKNNAVDQVKQAQRAFQDAVLTTPIGGLVTQADVVAGQNVSITDVIATVVDDSEIYFETEIDESDLGKISLNQPTEVTLNAYPDRTFYGTVAEILPQTKTTTSGATVVVTKIKLSDVGLRFTHGLNGQSNIILEEVKGVLNIPQEALRDDNTVFVKTAEGFQKVHVTPGIRSDTDVEIKQGLEEGQQVALNPSLIKQ